ncbi:MAG: N-acetyltransferase family protein [Halanaeroarchaeum sp.]
MIRPYEPADAGALWTLKQAFERGLGTGTGDEEKASAYDDKLDDAYREDYLEWVDRCASEDPRAVQVATDGEDLVGYAFVLPASLAYIWDAAVLNEIFVAESHRGTDVGDDLMEAALAVARDQDLPLDRVVLDVDRENDRARAFYERWGFDHWGEMVAREL